MAGMQRSDQADYMHGFSRKRGTCTGSAENEVQAQQFQISSNQNSRLLSSLIILDVVTVIKGRKVDMAASIG